MTARRELDERLRTLGDLSDILGSLKTLSVLETRKLARHAHHHQAVIDTIAEAATDFRSFHPGLLPPTPRTAVLLVVGSQRGFIGDFNRRLLQRAGETDAETHPLVLGVGERLCRELRDDPRLLATVDGPGVAEDVEGVLAQVVAALGRAAKEYGPLHVAALYQQPGQEQPTAEPIFPPYRDSPPAQAHADPPVLNLAPRDFLEALVDEYLRCVLEGILITSLLAESQARTSHLEAALDRLDERTEGLRRQRNQFRQEEITEEIEVILLSVEAMAEEHEAFMRRTSDGT